MAETVALALQIFEMQKRIGRDGGRTAFELLDCPVTGSLRSWTPDDLEKLVNRATRLGGMFGMLNTCLTRSVIRCRLMREAGVDARAVFGLDKHGGALAGHCWVVWEGGMAPGLRESNFRMLEVRPSPEKFPGWMPE
ncbi:MAG: lasso peptide biosynthesis B2 protein [bacterium]